MTLATDIANDCDEFDGIETVTLRQIRPGGSNAVSVASVTSGPLTRRQMLALGGSVDLDGDAKNFSLNVTDVGSDGVKRGDQIVKSDNTVWTVIDTELATLGTRWKCVCQQRP